MYLKFAYFPARKNSYHISQNLAQISSQNLNATRESKTRDLLFIYKVFGIRIFAKKTQRRLYFTHSLKDNIGEYVAKSCDNKQILRLVANLSAKDRDFVLLQIARMVEAHSQQNPIISNLTYNERCDLARIWRDFLPQILRLGDNLYFYDGYFLPINHFEVSVFWHKHSLSVLEEKTLKWMRGRDFIDVGGFIGDSAVIFEREFCDKNIYAFEPTKANFALMQRTLTLNNAKRVIPVNKALGAESGTMEINILGSSSSICLSCETNNKERIEITTLDEFARAHKIKVGFIKVDIEGFEMEFLKGAKEIISTQKPAMLISIYHQASDYFEIKPLIESWDLGYKFKIHKGTDFSLVAETVLFCEIL